MPTCLGFFHVLLVQFCFLVGKSFLSVEEVIKCPTLKSSSPGYSRFTYYPSLEIHV